MVTIHELVEKFYSEKTKDPIRRLKDRYYYIIESSCSAYDNGRFNRLCKELCIDILYRRMNPIRTESFMNMLWSYNYQKQVQEQIRLFSLIL